MVCVFFVFVFLICLLAAPHGMWDLSSPTRDRTCALCVGSAGLNHWTAREVPMFCVFAVIFYIFMFIPSLFIVVIVASRQFPVCFQWDLLHVWVYFWCFHWGRWASYSTILISPLSYLLTQNPSACSYLWGKTLCFFFLFDQGPSLFLKLVIINSDHLQSY